jgi:hypothetical protein
MIYRITRKAGSSSELEVGKFDNMAKAKAEIQNRLAEDARLNMKNVIYILYEGFDAIEQFDQSKLQKAPASSQESSEPSGGAGKGQSFRPTPLPTAPRPPGTPPPTWKDDENDENKDK